MKKLLSIILGLTLLSTFFVGQTNTVKAEGGPRCNEEFFVTVHDPVEGHVFEEDPNTGSVSIPVEIGVDWAEGGTTNAFALGWVKLFTTNAEIYPNRVLLAEKTSFNNQTRSHIVSFITSSSSFIEGNNILIAKAYIFGPGSLSSVCESPERNITVIKDQPDNSSLVVFVEPTTLSLTIDQRGELEAYAYRYENGNYDPITIGVNFVWTTTLGQIDSRDNVATFISRVEGTAILKVRASYQDKNANEEVYIHVTSSNTNNTGEDPDIPDEVILCVKQAIGAVRYEEINSGQSNPTEEENRKFYACFDRYNANITEEFIPVTNPLEPDVEECLKKAVGLQRFYEINSGQSRPTATEREKGTICFTGPGVAVPGTFAPVEPNKDVIIALRTLSNKLKINTFEKKTLEKTDGKKTDVIELGGIGLPNKQVYIYIFSTPLVFLADVDEDGNWTYTLEDPLDPGAHEVYVTMEESTDEFVRSDPLLVSVARAAPTDTNPSGSSFDINNNFLTWRNFYLIYVALGITAGVAGALIIRRRLFRKQNVDSQDSENPVT